MLLLSDGNSANAMESWGDGSRCLKLKGQMRYMPEWESIIFLGTPVYAAIAHKHMCIRTKLDENAAADK